MQPSTRVSTPASTSGLQVLVGDRLDLRAARDAGLDELDEARAGLGVQLDVRVGGERVVVGPRRRRGLRCR